MLKKICILTIAMCCISMVANAKKSQAPTIVLNNQIDSVNYALGLTNGYQIKFHYLRNDSSEIAIKELAEAMQRSYEGKIQEPSEIALVGKKLGIAIKETEGVGLAFNPAWTFNEKVFLQALVNGMYQDSVVMTGSVADSYFANQYQASAISNDTTLKAGKTIKSKCPYKTKHIALASQIDSINYALGFMNGSVLSLDILKTDSTHSAKKEIIDNINIVLKSKTQYHQLVEIGVQIGLSIKDQESNGLAGEPSLTTKFNLIKQGIIDGILNVDTNWNYQLAGEYIQQVMTDIKYGAIIKEGEQFLAENATRAEVTTTASGLQYEVIKMGEGATPLATSTVKVHYHGTLIDGTVFDSSVERGQPLEIALNHVIDGWTEGLQLMPVGSKFIFYIPYNLGYGSQNAGVIPAYSTLIFEVELLDIK